MKNNSKIDLKKVSKFFLSLTAAELGYVKITSHVASEIQCAIKKSKIEKKTFCDKFHIKITDYNRFIVFKSE